MHDKKKLNSKSIYKISWSLATHALYQWMNDFKEMVTVNLLLNVYLNLQNAYFAVLCLLIQMGNQSFSITKAKNPVL